MAKKGEQPVPFTEETEAKNFRLRVRLIERLEAYQQAYKREHHLRLTLTQLIDAAVSEYLDAHEIGVGIKTGREQ